MDLAHAVGHAKRYADHGEIGRQCRQIADQRRAKKGCVRCFRGWTNIWSCNLRGDLNRNAGTNFM